MKKQLIAAIAFGAAACAGAQAIYRCGSSYGQEACADAKVIEAPPAPSAADVAATRDDVRRESQMADELHAARKKEEASIKPMQLPRQESSAHGHGRPTPAKLAVFGKVKGKGSKKKSA
jgi:hypothetical protein